LPRQSPRVYTAQFTRATPTNVGVAGVNCVNHCVYQCHMLLCRSVVMRPWLLLLMLGAQLLQLVTTSLSSLRLDDVDVISCLTAKRHCLADPACRQRLNSIHDICGDNSNCYYMTCFILLSRTTHWSVITAHKPHSARTGNVFATFGCSRAS